MVGLGGDLRFGEADGGETRRRVDLVAAVVIGLLEGRSVVVQPVGLDDEIEIWPGEVDAVAVQPYLGIRGRKARAADEPQELALESGIGSGVMVEQRTQAACAGPRLQCLDCLAQPLPGDQLATICLADSALELIAAEAGGEVDQGRDGIGDRDTVHHTLILIEMGLPVDSDSPPTTPGNAAWNRDVDQGGVA